MDSAIKRVNNTVKINEYLILNNIIQISVGIE